MSALASRRGLRWLLLLSTSLSAIASRRTRNDRQVAICASSSAGVDMSHANPGEAVADGFVPSPHARCNARLTTDHWRR